MPHDDQEMMPLPEAQQLALSRVSPLPAAPMPIDDALGLVVAEDVVAAEDVPPFANSAMDGYAVRAEDAASAPVELEVVGIVAAGSAREVAVGPGQAVQIMTGAPIPPGTTGIAIVERSERLEPKRVRLLDAVTPGAHIRAVGSDIKKGATVLRAGALLSPAHIGVLASVGVGAVTAYRRPRVGVLSTGDELVEFAGDGAALPLRPGQIRDSNRHGMLALLRRDGFEPVDLGIVVDTKEAVSGALGHALENCDAVLTTGGVSMGEFDYVKVVLAELAAGAPGAGVEVLSVAIRPAKPLVLAWLPRPGKPERSEAPANDAGRLVPVFGLPGNPVSSMVSYQVIALPALRVLAGHAPAPPPIVTGLAADDFPRHPDGKTHLVRVLARWRGDGRLEATSAGGQMSHQLSAMSGANALAVLPDGEGVGAGDQIGLIVFGSLG
jgi:molybdopterin molybdotransferase